MFKIKLLPEDKKFFVLFNALSKILVEATTEFNQFIKNYADLTQRAKHIQKIIELENQGDLCAADLRKELFINFVTPLDREDIHSLTKILGSIIDHVHGATIRFGMYNVEAVRDLAVELSDILVQSAYEVEKIVSRLNDFSSLEKLMPCIDKLHELEEQGDTFYRQAIQDLFSHEKDVLEVVKWKDIFERLENAIDKCDDATNVILGVVLKYA